MTFTEGPIHERSDYVVETPAQPVLAPPVVADVPVEQHVIVGPTPAVAAQTRTAYASHFAPDAIIAALFGLALLLVGLIAIVRGGFDGQMSDPVVQVLGFTHTTTLGLIEIVAGLALLLSGATRSRSGELFFASVLGIAAFVGAVQAESFRKSLALESSMAWLIVVLCVIVVLAALLMPRFTRRSTVVEAV